nr:hypothetical protein [uncultured Halomonas sp.]
MRIGDRSLRLTWLLVVVVVFLPEGLIPGLVKFFGRFRKRKEGMS